MKKYLLPALAALLLVVFSLGCGSTGSSQSNAEQDSQAPMITGSPDSPTHQVE